MSANSWSSTWASTASNGMSGRSAPRQRVQERAVGDRVPEVAALGVGEREPARGATTWTGPVASLSRSATIRAELGLLVARRAARAWRPGCGSRSCARGSARARVSRGPWLKKSTQPGTTTWGSPSRPATRSRSGPVRVDAVHQRVGELGERVVDDALQRALLAQVLHRRARRRRWRGRSPARGRRATSASRSRITPGVVWPSIVIPTQCSPSVPSAEPASWTMPAIAAAALSKIGREMPLRPRMSTTECMTQTSLSPTKAPNARRPDARGRDEQLRHADRQRLHRGRARAARPRRRPGTARRGSRPSANSRATSARTPSQHQRDGRAARAGVADLVERVAAPPRATSSCGDVGRDSAARRGCPSRSRRRPRRSAVSRSRT